jgi:aminoglycoside phosphotransferase (APT) family kinase protein
VSQADPKSVFPKTGLGEITQVAPIKIGLSGAGVFSVTTTTGQYVVRFHATSPELWTKEITMQRLAASAGVAPKIVHVDDRQRATVTERITYFPFGAALGHPDHRGIAVGSLIAQLKALHATPLPAGDSQDPVQFARGIWDDQAKRPGFPAWALPLSPRLKAAADALAKDPRKVFSHCDLNPANVLWDGVRVWFVDWEGAAPAHPYLDLAIFTNFMSVPQADALKILAAQEGVALTSDETQLFALLRDHARLVYGSVFLRLIPDLTKVEFHDREATATLAECFAQMMAGKLALNLATGQAAIAAAFFKQCEEKPS